MSKPEPKAKTQLSCWSGRAGSRPLHQVLALIRQLYAIERRAKEFAAEERQEQLPDVWLSVHPQARSIRDA